MYYQGLQSIQSLGNRDMGEESASKSNFTKTLHKAEGAKDFLIQLQVNFSLLWKRVGTNLRN